MKESSS